MTNPDAHSACLTISNCEAVRIAMRIRRLTIHATATLLWCLRQFDSVPKHSSRPIYAEDIQMNNQPMVFLRDDMAGAWWKRAEFNSQQYRGPRAHLVAYDIRRCKVARRYELVLWLDCSPAVVRLEVSMQGLDGNPHSILATLHSPDSDWSAVRQVLKRGWIIASYINSYICC
jgi:hypothetical protein